MDGFPEVPGSGSGHFRSRVPTTVSHRRLNVSMSQSSTSPEDDVRPLFSGPRVSSSLSTVTVNALSTTSQTPTSRWRGQRLAAFLMMFACMVKFTFDVVLGHASYNSINVSPLDDLPQAFRLSRISDIYNPESFQPYAISPVRKEKSLLNITACLCITQDQLPTTLQAVSDWPGYASVVLIHPDELSGSAKRGLRGDLKAASRQPSVTNKLYLHLYSYPRHVPPPYNSLTNLARFHSPTLAVVLIPSVDTLRKLNQHISIWQNEPLPRGAVATIFTEAATDLERSFEKGEFTRRSVVFLDRDQGPWCPERFLSSAKTQWIHCLWHTWLLSRGDARVLTYPSSLGEPIQEDPRGMEHGIDILVISARSVGPKGTVLTLGQEKIDANNSPKFKFESCVHLSRNLHALRQKEEPSSFEAHYRWLRQACVEAFDTWEETLF